MEESQQVMEEQLYEDFAEKLLYLESTGQIRQSLTNPTLSPEALESAFGRVESAYQQGGKTSQLALLNFVRGIVGQELGLADSIPGPSTPIREAADLAARAMRAPGLLEAYMLLRDHRDLLSAKVYDRLQAQQLLESKTGPSGRGIILLNIFARLISDEERIITATLLWASLMRNQYRFQNALRHLRRVENLPAAMNSTIRDQVMSFKAAMLDELGRAEEALAVYNEVYDAARAKEEDPIAYRTGLNLVGLYRSLGRYEKALQVVEECEQKRSEMVPPEFVSRMSNYKGLLLEDLGRYEEGEVAYEQSLIYARQAEDQQLEFVALNNQAFSYQKRGLPREAVQRFRKILRLTERQGNPPRIASSRNNLAQALLDADQPAEALQQFQMAWVVKMQNEDYNGEATSLLGAGDAERNLGDVEQAKNFYNLALIPATLLYMREGKPDMLAFYATRMMNLEAIPDEESANSLTEYLQIFRETGNINMELLLTPVLGSYYARQGQEGKAIDLYHQALEHGSELKSRSPSLLQVATGLAQLLARKKDGQQQAYDLLTGVLDQIDRQVQGVLIETRRSEIISHGIEAFSAMIDLLLENGHNLDLPGEADPIDLAFNYHEAAKARTFIAQLADLNLPPPENVPQEMREREAQLLGLERELQTLGPGEENETASYRLERLSQVETELTNLLQEMMPYAPEYVRLRFALPSTKAEIQALLRKHSSGPTALVSFFCGREATTTFVVRSDSALIQTFRCSVRREQIESVARRLQRTFNGAPDEFPPYPPIRAEQPEARSLEFLDEIGSNLLAFLPSVEGVELLCIAPHGPLHLLPFHALSLPDGTYLLEHFAVTYCPSASSLSYIFAERSNTVAATDGRRAYVTGVASRSDVHPEFFEQDEAIFDSQSWQVIAEEGPQAATPERVRQVLRDGYDVVHLTCHGYFDTRTPLNSGLLLADGRERPPRTPEAIPILNRRNFLLTGSDLLSARILTRLVVLRACSTGIQAARNQGDEFEGLSRALLYSGSPAVLVSLWNVDQQSSQQLLSRFYSYLASSQGAIEKWRALWMAQKDFIQSPPEPYLRHPYHWAPLILSGDWR